MPKKLFIPIFLSVLILAGAGCGEKGNVPAAENQNENKNIGENVNKEAAEANSETIAPEESTKPEEVGGVSFVSYTNKSIKYTIDRPDGWYWRHYIERELATTHPGIIDYFITDRNPLPRLESEYLGRIVIEVSGRSTEELAANVSDLSVSDATIGGVPAKKYEGTRNNEMVQNQKVIAYHFQKDGKTFRIVYAKNNSTAEEEAVFEHIVSSLSFEE